jgi:phosphoadenosine phosphosulfate reductase
MSDATNIAAAGAPVRPVNPAPFAAESAGRAIELYARPTAGYEQRVAATLQRLRAAATAHAGRIVQATSLGAEDVVLTDLIARHELPITVATLETGALHNETVALIVRTEQHYQVARGAHGAPGLKIERWLPQAEHVVAFVQRHGDKAMVQSIALRKACCQLRKLEPLSRMLAGRTAWLTGLRREQSDARAEVPFASTDDAGRTKLNPLADWSQADVWHYIAQHSVPYNPLHDAFFPSIGCAPCTRAVSVGEDIRAGRWWWEQEAAKECGLHVSPAVGDPAAAVVDFTVTSCVNVGPLQVSSLSNARSAQA